MSMIHILRFYSYFDNHIWTKNRNYYRHYSSKSIDEILGAAYYETLIPVIYVMMWVKVIWQNPRKPPPPKKPIPGNNTFPSGGI